jgi:hypothetical protein
LMPETSRDNPSAPLWNAVAPTVKPSRLSRSRARSESLDVAGQCGYR